MTDTPPPATPAAAPMTPGTPGPKQTLALVSFIVGLAAFVFSWVPILGLAGGIVAIILGVQAKNKEPGAPRWMWIVGIIAGAVAILGNIIWTITWILPLLFFASVPGVVY